MWDGILQIAKVLFWPTAMLAVLSFCILCSETIGVTELSRVATNALAWTLVITGILSFYMAGPAFLGDS
jgi:hypothetical protein